MAVRIGISGWNYPRWRKVFYPAGLPQSQELAYASRAVDSIEVNGSFYSLLRPDAVKRWYAEVPADFVFAVKGSRFITHMKRLSGVETALANFFASGVLALREKLGPILWQLPPQMAFDEARLDGFLELLPKTTAAAGALAKRHDHRIKGRAVLRTPVCLPMRYALEVRHPSFHDVRFFDLLRRRGVALCIADTAGLFPDFDEVTADFVYVRLHGEEKLYESGYSRAALERWAARIARWKKSGDVYVYFDNDARVRAPFDARTLRAIQAKTRVPPLPRLLRDAGEPARETWPQWNA